FGCAAAGADREQESAAVRAAATEPPGTTAPTLGDLDAAMAERFAALALACIHREYPNKIAHVMASEADAGTPRELTPAFYGCFDWHRAVHGHWMLVRLIRRFPSGPFAARARAALDRNLTKANLAREAAYVGRADRAGFERPYGLAWLLQLAAELRQWDDPDARRWAAALAPLERIAADRLGAWLPKLGQPIRSGEHSQTAFALGLALDWARTVDEAELARIIEAVALRFHAGDRSCPLSYEPS